MSTAPSTVLTTGRRWPYLVIGAIGGAALLLLAQQLLSSDPGAETVTEPVALATAEVTRADLVEEVEWAGEVAYSSRAALTRDGGTVTSTVPVGTPLERGDTIVEIDAEPVVLFYGGVPTFRTMSEGDEGPDVLVLETNLVELGYDPEGTVTVDESFTYYTGLMVQRWQEDTGVEVTGEVDADDVLVLEGSAVVLDEPVLGARATGEVLSLASQADLAITVPVAVSEADEFTAGDSVTVVLADETERAASVDVVGSEVTSDQNGSTIDVTITLDDGTAGLLEGPVTVRAVGEEVRDAIVVPTRALVALAEGGFAVERAGSEGTTGLVGIELGTFDDGLVEVTSGDLNPGDLVVVPR
ncbi:MAG: peptidoglycan-binding protein [Acidimicrobiales bacterium]